MRYGSPSVELTGQKSRCMEGERLWNPSRKPPQMALVFVVNDMWKGHSCPYKYFKLYIEPNNFDSCLLRCNPQTCQWGNSPLPPARCGSECVVVFALRATYCLTKAFKQILPRISKDRKWSWDLSESKYSSKEQIQGGGRLCSMWEASKERWLREFISDVRQFACK